MTRRLLPALEVRQLSVTFGGALPRVALRDVDITFPAGTLTAVMGPPGSGKSTLLRCAAGLQRPTGGQVLVEDQDVTGWDEHRLARWRSRRLGLLFRSAGLLPHLTAAQNVALPRRLSGRPVDEGRIAELLEQVGLGDRAEHLPAALSGGQQQRVALARALVDDPAVVLADEPTGALGPGAADDVLALLRWCVDDLGRSVVIVTHDPRTATFADSVVLLVDGQAAGRMPRPSPDAVARRLASLGEPVPLTVAGREGLVPAGSAR